VGDRFFANNVTFEKKTDNQIMSMFMAFSPCGSILVTTKVRNLNFLFLLFSPLNTAQEIPYLNRWKPLCDNILQMSTTKQQAENASWTPTPQHFHSYQKTEMLTKAESASLLDTQL
jgi:hypothetical protein